MPQEVLAEILRYAPGIAVVEDLVAGRTFGLETALLEANAALKRDVRRGTGENWKAHVPRLPGAEGVIE